MEEKEKRRVGSRWRKIWREERQRIQMRIRKGGRGRLERDHLHTNNWKKSCSDIMHSPSATDKKNMSLVLVVCMCHHLSTLSTTTVMIK